MLQAIESISQYEEREIHRGDIYMCNLPSESGSIQANYRPVIILQNNTGNHFATTTIIAPISKKGKNLPTQVKIREGIGGILFTSYVLCEQIRTINKNWLDKYIGSIRINSTEFSAIQNAIMISLGLTVQSHN